MASLADLFRAAGLRKSEVTRQGDLPDAFLGTEHDGHTYWELMPLSLELLFGGTYYDDDDLRQFMLGLLAWIEENH